MNKIISQLVSIGYKILDTDPDFTQIDTELKQIENKLNES